MTEVVDRVGLQRLLEPADIVVFQHLRRAHRPFEAVRPVGVAGAGVDEELRFIARRGARRAHDRLVELGIAGAAEGSPADLEGAEATRAILRHHLAHAVRHFHQERAVRSYLRAIDAAEQPPHRLPGELAENVPERDIDAADHVGERAAAAHPERVLVQFFRDPLGLERILAAVERLEHLEPGLHQPAVREHAAMPDDLGIGVHGNQRMDRILLFDLRGPAALRALAEQRYGMDRSDLYGGHDVFSPPCLAYDSASTNAESTRHERRVMLANWMMPGGRG